MRTLACHPILEAEHKSISQKPRGIRRAGIPVTDISRDWLHSQALSCLTSPSHLPANSYCLIMQPPCQKLVYSGAKNRDEEGRRQERLPTQTALQSQARRVSRLFERRLKQSCGHIPCFSSSSEFHPGLSESELDSLRI